MKITNKRQSDGSYFLSVGRGRNKVTDRMYQAESTHEQFPKKWFAGHHGPFDTMKEAKQAWGEWAARAYTGEEDAAESPSPERDGQPSTSSPLPPPPSFKRGSKFRKPIPSPPSRDLEHAYNHDPFDPRFRDTKTREITPLGVLVEIAAYHQKHQTVPAQVVRLVQKCLSTHLTTETQNDNPTPTPIPAVPATPRRQPRRPALSAKSEFTTADILNDADTPF